MMTFLQVGRNAIEQCVEDGLIAVSLFVVGVFCQILANFLLETLFDVTC